MILRLLLLLLILFLSACGSKEHAGGTTVETTNGIAGVVEFDGEPQEGVRVLVVAETFVPGSVKLENPYLDYTDKKGRFSFPLPPQGRYRIIARDSSSGNSAMREASIENSDLEELSLQLAPSGNIKVSLQSLAIQAGDRIALPGSDVVREITQESMDAGVVTLEGVPAGTYAGLVWASSLEWNPPFSLSSEPVVVASEELITIAEGATVPSQVEWDLQGVLFDSTSPGVYLPTLFGNPSAVVIEARVKPTPGMLGGEVVSLGNHVGFRMDASDSMISIYAYSSFAGPSEWMVLSGYVKRSQSTLWVDIALVDDPDNGRWELWLNGELQPVTPADSLKSIAWDKGGMETWVGKHSLYPSQNHFQGEIAWVRIQAIPAASWIPKE